MCFTQTTYTSGTRTFLIEFLECCGQAPPLCKDLGSRRTFHDCLATLCWGTKGTSAQSRREEHRRAGESCVDSKAVGLHGLVLTDKASLNGQPLRRRSTTLSFKTCAGIATSAACALVLMFRAVSETRHAVWLFCCSRQAQPPHVRCSLFLLCASSAVLQMPWLNMSLADDGAI